VLGRIEAVYRRVLNAITIAKFLKRESNRKAILRASRAGALVSARFNANAVNRLPLPNLKSKPSILIIYNPHLRQCVRYRVQQKIEAFRREDIQYEVVPENEIVSTSELNGYSHFLFQRPEPSERTIKMMKYATERGKVILDIDDAIFSEEALDLNPGLAGLSAQLVSSFYKAVPFYQEMLRQSHVYCASTQPIADLASGYSPGKVVIWRNSLDDQHLSVATYYSTQDWDIKLPDNILMTSLSSGVENDLNNVRSFFEKLFGINKGAVLSLAGPTPKMDWLNHYKDRVRNLPALNYLPHLFRVARFPVTVIPLADHLFNRCKSAIRMQESFLLSASVLCSESPESTYAKEELRASDSIHILNDKGRDIEFCLEALAKWKSYKDIRGAFRDRIEKVTASGIYLPNVCTKNVKDLLQ
jgi:hypothetical protein